MGINNRGELIVDADGEERIIRTGEVSVRGIYGYV
jgi:BirA family biotin operon repressor/biotin-[acetyl-CoA-carboxylase] ligase